MYFRNCYFAFFAKVCLGAQSRPFFSVHFNQQKNFFSSFILFKLLSDRLNFFFLPFSEMTARVFVPDE